MKRPPDELLPLLHSIEEAVVITYKEQTRLADKDVEFVFERLTNCFKLFSQGKEDEYPTSSSSMRQALIDGILDRLELRENLEADYVLINSTFQPGGRPIPNLEALYAMAFKQLHSSARFWRKQGGRTGYLHFIRDQFRNMGHE